MGLHSAGEVDLNHSKKGFVGKGEPCIRPVLASKMYICNTPFIGLTIFRDPLALSRFDDEHSETEERWTTLGQADNGRLLVVIHTFQELDQYNAAVRIISARPATRHEQRQYESTT